MYAIGFKQYGGPEVFEELQLDIPTYNENQLLIQTIMVGVNPYDDFLRSGAMKDIRPLDFPIIPGTELVGKVIKAGKNVTDYQIGDIVIARPPLDGYSEYIAISQNLVMKKPENMSLEIAAGFGAVCVTAFWSITGFAPIKKGQTVIIQGASGAVGGVAVQIAKDYGLHVIGIGNSRNRNYVLSLGADEFVAYNEENIFDKLKDRGDFVFDASFGGKGAENGLALVKDGGYYLSLTDVPEPVSDKQVTITSMRLTKEMTAKKAFTYLNELYQRKGIIMETAVTFPLTIEGVQQAHEAIKNKTIAGKIILKAQ